MKRFVFCAEIPLVYALILFTIWRVPKELTVLAVCALFAYVGWSWKLAGDTPKTIGLQPPSIFHGLRVALCIVLANVVVITWIHTMYCPTAGSNWGVRGYAVSSVVYFFWALLQQLIVCGYFAHRIYVTTSSEYLMCVGTSLTFSLAHFPNPVLMALTLVNGVACAMFFKHYRNLYLISAMHVFVAVYAFMLFSYEWHHAFRIGRGYFY